MLRRLLLPAVLLPGTVTVHRVGHPGGLSAPPPQISLASLSVMRI
jgi:hypothetical protein